jgi:hypothetical protein
MRKLPVLVAFMAITLVVPLAVSGQKGKPPKPPVYATVTIEQEINSGEADVLVGRDVQTYGPVDQALYIHGDLLPPLGSTGFPGAVAELRALGPDGAGFYGPYSGQIRVLNDRIDHWFDTSTGCGEAITSDSPCRFRVVVADGSAVYSGTGKKKTLIGVAFNEGRYLLDYRWCDPATNPDCYIKLYGCYDDRACPGVPPGGEGYVYATAYVRFQQ